MTQQKQNHTERAETPRPAGASQTPSGKKTVTEGADSRGSPENTGPEEIGGRRGPEPTRYGDWENKGKCVDF